MKYIALMALSLVAGMCLAHSESVVHFIGVGLIYVGVLRYILFDKSAKITGE